MFAAAPRDMSMFRDALDGHERPERMEAVMRTLAIVAFAACLAPMASLAQNTGGAIGGAVGGAAVGGPVGAAVGAIVGSMLPPQPSVVYQGPIVVGEALPDTFTYYDVPKEHDYEYVILNNKRVIVERRTHRVVRIIED